MHTDVALPVPAPVPAPLAPPQSPTKPMPRKAASPAPQPKPARTAKATAEIPASPAVPVAVVLFGPDANGRPHGARFDAADAAAVERAADLMDLYCFPADTDVLRELAAKLPAGRVFPASGKALVPFASAALYERLCAATGTPAAPRPAKAAAKPAEAGGSTGAGQGQGAGGAGAGDPPSRIGAKAPADHSQIGLGSLVLARGDDEDDEGYYPAKVMLTKADDHFVLTWADYPDLPQITRARTALALLHPDVASGLA